MILAAHQPHYMPWLGYLDKMAKADVFVVMDDLQYERENFQNRQRLKLNHGPAWVTVPLERGAQGDLICDKRINDGGCTREHREHWQRRTWMTLRTHYGRARYWSEYAGELEEVFTHPWEKLVELDLHMIELARRWFGITVPMLRSSSLELVGQKTDRIIDMCKKVGARVYLSGRGGSTDYLDLAALEAAGITVMWQSFTHPQYAQRYGQLGFVPYLGFLDLVLNCGPDSRRVLFGAPADVRPAAGAHP